MCACVILCEFWQLYMSTWFNLHHISFFCFRIFFFSKFYIHFLYLSKHSEWNYKKRNDQIKGTPLQQKIKNRIRIGPFYDCFVRLSHDSFFDLDCILLFNATFFFSLSLFLNKHIKLSFLSFMLKICHFYSKAIC